MKKVYYLSTCSTCSRIMNQLSIGDDFIKQDIKKESITADQIDEMKELAGSYEAFFSRTAMKYKSMGLKDKNLGEADYRMLIIGEYTFLKRPVFIIDGKIFIGNSKKNIASLANELGVILPE